MWRKKYETVGSARGDSMARKLANQLHSGGEGDLMKSGRILITFTLVCTMVLPVLIHWNQTHVFNPAWPGHARFHVALGDCMMFGYSVMGLWLLRRRSSSRSVDVLVAALAPAIAWGSFFMASFLPNTGENQMPHIVGMPLNLFIAGLLLFATVLGYGLYSRGLHQETSAKTL
jgi:hypothetical protein